MKVSLIYATPDAADLMIFTKNTRLRMSPKGLEEIRGWSAEQKMAELEYMSNTIPSSWEFADLIFMFEEVSRAFTHQLVRTRTASFAQQTMRVVKMEDFKYTTGPTIQGKIRERYDQCMADIAESYNKLIDMGAKIEDARGVLPTNICTNIVMKINLRNFADLVKKRTSPRVQGEYSIALQLMVTEVLKVWPWAELFIVPKSIKSHQELNTYCKTQLDKELTDNPDIQPFETEAWRMMKCLDLIRQET